MKDGLYCTEDLDIVAITRELEYAKLGELYLDPMCPRLGRRRRTSRKTSQDSLLEMMQAWVLDEPANSFLESGGLWAQEPLIAVREELYGKECLVVVEGNRRLAALKLLLAAREGQPVSRKWGDLVSGSKIPEGLFNRIPYVIADSRADVQAFLGFRHVTGIKQWDADEKAAFIASMIDDGSLSYQQVAKKIGSNAPTVRKHYVAYQVLLQAEDTVEKFRPETAEKRFAILYMALATVGAQQYLHIDFMAAPEKLKEPVPRKHLTELAQFCRWLFGTLESPHIVTDTRQAADFGVILESQEAVQYLESSPSPRFDVAFRIAGGDEQETARYVMDAAHNLELALMRAHAFKSSVELQKAVKRLGGDARQLLGLFPAIAAQV